MKKCIALLLVLLAAAAVLAGCHTTTLSLDKTELTMTVGDSAVLSAGGAAKVNWSSSDDKIAAVNAGTVSAKSAGTAVITASLENGGKATCNVTVTDKLISGITLSAKSARVEEGKTFQLTAVYSPADASQTALTWESSDVNIVTVNNEGYVTGIGEGTATVTCKSSNGIEAACTVTVGGIAELPTSAATLPPASEKPTQQPAETETPKKDSESRDNARQPSGGGYIFPDSSSRYLSESETAAALKNRSGHPVSDSFAQDAINEIYARNGYIFRTPEIRAYYEAQSWYRPDPGYDGSLNEIEQYNVNLLSGY